MAAVNPSGLLTRQRLDAVLFDMDGVLTDTARMHALSWKTLFDEFLRARAAAERSAFEPFDAERDYREHVDGKLRADGVRDFLASRGLSVPETSPDPTTPSVASLAARKDGLVQRILDEGAVSAYDGSVRLVRRLRDDGLRLGVVSASRNCEKVLRAVRIHDLFDTRVDGVVAADRGLPGKPAPDTYLAAASDLAASPSRAAVIEDACAGVEAGRAGGFAVVVGVARQGNASELTNAGAHLVVEDLAEMLPEDAS